jgi:hypothetical protein
MAADLLIVAALLVVTGAVVVLVCCWPAIAPRRRYSAAPLVAHEPAPLRRDDFTLTN